MAVSNKTHRPADPLDAGAIEAEIERIQKLKPDEVRALWRETFNREVPKALTKDLLVRTICWHIQEKAYGGHSPAMLKLLASYAKGRPVEADRLKRLKPGTEVVREYQGKRHTVVITTDGYRWEGDPYPSLSAIARAITGSNWNGPRFFGLREDKDAQKSETSLQPRERGRKVGTESQAPASAAIAGVIDAPARTGGLILTAAPAGQATAVRAGRQGVRNGVGSG